jgi:prophage maintenance system killer protein
MLTASDVIEINKVFDRGVTVNANSLEFAEEMAEDYKSWLTKAAIYSRAILIDHVFEEGNKRTAAAVIMALMEINNVQYNPEKIPHIIVSILKRNMTKIREIERCIKDGLI